MKVRELLDTNYHRRYFSPIIVELVRNKELIFRDDIEKLNEILKGYEVKEWAFYYAKDLDRYEFEIDVE